MYKRPTGAMAEYTQAEQRKAKQLQESDSSGVEKKAFVGNAVKYTDSYSFALGVVPPAASLLALVASFKNADKYYDTKLSKKLDRDIANE